jgi:uroporphyrinogen-III synthase
MTTDKSFAHKPSSKAPQNAVLANHCVLVTRPEQQQAELIAALEAWGAQTIPLPLLSISPPSEGEPAARLRRSLLELDLFDSLLFVSTNAVRAGVASIEGYWPQFPVGLQILAIGPSTAALARELLRCEVAVAAGGSTSEELLASGLLGDLEGKRVGIFRGEGGRDALAEGIRQRGGRVEYFEVYRRSPCDYSDTQLVEVLDGKSPTALTITSGESLDALLSLAPRLEKAIDIAVGKSIRVDVLRMPLIVPSARVKKLALAKGFTAPIDAGGADARSFARALSVVSGKTDPNKSN